MNSQMQILDIAERRMRAEGYNAVSYRDIAAEMGIKSASLHYHFPKKADLGLALVERYASNFHAVLESETDGKDAQNSLAVFVDLHRRALTDQGLICLCAVFGAEAQGLPEPISGAVKGFFDKNIIWLTGIYKDLDQIKPTSRAKAVVSMLEGALIVASVNKDLSVFEAAADMVLKT